MTRFYRSSGSDPCLDVGGLAQSDRYHNSRGDTWSGGPVAANHTGMTIQGIITPWHKRHSTCWRLEDVISRLKAHCEALAATIYWPDVANALLPTRMRTERTANILNQHWAGHKRCSLFFPVTPARVCLPSTGFRVRCLCHARGIGLTLRMA